MAIINKQKLAAFLESEIRSQRRWMDEHGRSIAGYVDHYGSKDDPEHYGDGGEAIYRADKAHLDQLEEQYRNLTGGRVN